MRRLHARPARHLFYCRSLSTAILVVATPRTEKVHEAGKHARACDRGNPVRRVRPQDSWPRLRSRTPRLAQDAQPVLVCEHAQGTAVIAVGAQRRQQPW